MIIRNKSKKGNLGKFVLYSAISAIVFLIIYSIWFSSFYYGEKPRWFETIAEKASLITGKAVSIFSGSIDIEDFSKNSENYAGENITATGEYQRYLFKDWGCGYGTFLIDKKGYEIGFCPVNDPDMRFEVGRRYTIKGTIKEVEIRNMEGTPVDHYILMEE